MALVSNTLPLADTPLMPSSDVVRVVAAILTEIGALTYTNDEEFHQDFELMNRRFHRHESFKTSENPKVSFNDTLWLIFVMVTDMLVSGCDGVC